MLGLRGGVSYIFQGGGGGGNWKLHFSGPPLKTMVKGVGMILKIKKGMDSSKQFIWHSLDQPLVIG